MEHYVSTVAFPVLARGRRVSLGRSETSAICPQPIIRSERRWHQRMTPLDAGLMMRETNPGMYP
jgi:hypothetical protein